MHMPINYSYNFCFSAEVSSRRSIKRSPQSKRKRGVYPVVSSPPGRRVAETSKRSRWGPPRSSWWSAGMMQWRSPQLFRVNSVLVSGYVLLHLRSISDFTVKVKRLIRYNNSWSDQARLTCRKGQVDCPDRWGRGRPDPRNWWSEDRANTAGSCCLI